MGCGHSSLKGEKVDTVGGSAGGQPIKQVRTNFTNPDYEADASARRETVYAPHETARTGSAQGPKATMPSNTQLGGSTQAAPDANPDPGMHASAPPNLRQEPSAIHPGDFDSAYPHQSTGGRASDQVADTNNLEPYHTLEGDEGLASPTDIRQKPFPHERLAEANVLTSTEGYKGQFAGPGSSDEPYAHQGHEKHHASKHTDSHARDSNSNDKFEDAEEGEGGKKKGWYARLQDAKRGPGLSNLSDEEYEKQVGMSRSQMADYTANAPGVGGNQAAGKLAMGETSGLGGYEAQNGLGGWGNSAGSEAVIR